MLKIYRYIFLLFVLVCYHQAPLDATNRQKKASTTEIGCFFFSTLKNLENIKISTEKKFVLNPYFINTTQPNKALKKIPNNKTKPTRILIDIRHLQQQLKPKKKDNSIGNGNKKQKEVNDEGYNALKTYLESIASHLDDALNTPNSQIIYFVIRGTKSNKYSTITNLQSYMSQVSSRFQEQNKTLPLLQLFVKQGDNKPFIALSENEEQGVSMIMCATDSFYKQSKRKLEVVNKNDKYKIVLQKKSVLEINHSKVIAKSILLFAGKTNNNVKTISTVIKNKVNSGNNNATNYYIDLTANSLPSTTKDEVVDYFEKVTGCLKNIQKEQSTEFLESIKDNIWFVISPNDKIEDVKALLGEKLEIELGERKDKKDKYPWLSLDGIKFVKPSVDGVGRNSFNKNPSQSSSGPTSVQNSSIGSNSLNVPTKPEHNTNETSHSQKNDQNKNVDKNDKPSVINGTNNSTTTGLGPVEPKTRNLTNFIIIAAVIVFIIIVGYLISRASKPKQAFPNRGSRPIQPSTSHTPVPKEPPVSKQIKAQASSSKGSPAKAPLVFKYKSFMIAIALLLLLALLLLIRRSVIPNK